MKKLLLLFLFLAGYASYAQLPDFTLTVTPTPQTCLGNGSLSFEVFGTAPGADIGYEVYLLPDTTTPVVTTTNTTVSSLVAGTYMVVATQSLDDESNTASATATITNDGSTLEYALEPTNVRCGEDGEIEVNVTTGIGVAYEIIAGPETFPPQASNIFTGLLAGQYQVRVMDDCGNAIVTTIQLVQIPTDIIMGDPVFPPGPLPVCDEITVDHFFGALTNYEIFFPLTFEFTVYPPGGGAPIIVTQDYPAGNNLSNHLIANIPFFEGQEYTYDLQVTDVCGNVFNHDDNIVNESFHFETLYISESCGNFYFRITPLVYVGPYTVTFLSAPAGFTPEDFNASHPNFNAGEIFYGSDANPVPLGMYNIQITDACGNTAVQEMEIVDEAIPTTLTSLDPVSCSGQIGISLSGGRNLQSVTIIEAPDAYAETLPDDVSEFISGFNFLITGMPLGAYTFELVDECGVTYIVEVVIQPTVEDLLLLKAQRPGCEEGMGSIRLSLNSGNSLQTVIITTAPDSFGETLPFDVSSNIAGGAFYMNSLPEGVYTFETVDNCGTERNEAITIEGYEIESNDVEIIPNCGSFNIDLDFVSNGVYVESFWLQEYDPVTGTWGHPLTGVPYIDGTLPGATNSIFLINGQLNINLAYTGEFRIVRAFHTFSNGSALNQRCLEEIYTFTFDGAPQIDGAYVFPCADDEYEVIINASGVAPLTYEITTMDGAPFPVDNGTSNLFSGLEEGLYNFRVTDVCGSFLNIQVEVSGLEPMEVIAEGFCDGEASTLTVQDFSFLTYEWYAEDDPDTILSTGNTLTFPSFDPDTDSGVYMVNIISTNPGSCINQTLEYEIVPVALPNAGEDSAAELCNENTSLSLAEYLDGQDEGGVWEDTDNTGSLTGGMFDTEGIAAGTYEFTYVVTNSCGITDEAVVSITLNDTPLAPVIDAVTPICEGEDIQLSTTAVPGAVYEWSGPGEFSSDEQNPVIEDATTASGGVYTLTITVDGCTSPAASVTITVDAAAQAGEDVTTDICNDGNDVDLTDFLSGGHDEGGTWQDIEGTGALNGNLLSIAGLAAGTYQFIYTVSNACDSTDESTLTVELRDMPQVTAEGVAPVCEGSDIQLAASEVANAAYLWTGPDGFESDEQNPLIEDAPATANGLYSLVVTVDGCTSPAATVNVTVNPAPQFTLNGPAELCEGQTGILAVDPDNFETSNAVFEWYLDDELLPEVTGSSIEILETGSYEVIVENNGCTATREIVVTQNTNAFSVELEAGCVDFEYVISITNMEEIGDASISWSGPQGFSSSEAAAVITGLPAGEYSVTVINAEGCTAEAVMQVDNTNCEVPRGVSPNNDGLNDSFDLSNLDVREIKIFNRYGLKVYEAQSYTNEWHGQSDKGDLPTGTYYYMITLSAGKQITGWVYLQREIR